MTSNENAAKPGEKVAAIAIDGWKRDTFERHLKAAGYTWADRAELRRIENERRRLSRETGERWSIDHVVPLNSQDGAAHRAAGTAVAEGGGVRVLHNAGIQARP